MESLICEPGPKNPLVFLSLSIVNRVPSYKPDEKETLNQLECMHDLINNVSAVAFRVDSVKTAVAVAIDALLSVSSTEAKKSVNVRVSALKCLLLLTEKLAACGINCFFDIMPGILSKTLKVIINRVEVEVDTIINLALEVLFRIIQCFWLEQEYWSEGDDVLLKQKYRNNIDLVICSLKPLIKCERRVQFDNLICNIFKVHLDNSIRPSESFLKLFLIQSSFNSSHSGKASKNSKLFTQVFNAEVIEWFSNSELKSVHEEVLKEKIQMIIGLMNLKFYGSFLISDLFSIVSKLTSINASYNDVSIEFTSDSLSNVFDRNVNNQEYRFTQPSTLEFRSRLKLSKDFFNLLEVLFAKMIEFDSSSVINELLAFDTEPNDEMDSTNNELDRIIQKIDLSARFFKYQISDELFKNCLQYHDRTSCDYSIESGQMIHLATLKLIWSFICNSKCDIETVKLVLLTILSGIASKWIVMKEFSFQILKGISGLYGSGGEDLSGFIQKHEKFLLDRLACQLAVPSLFPEAPQIVACLVRDIVKTCTALSFTDLLVKKVAENLAIYQKHPAYCKDLLSVAEESIKSFSRIEDSPVIEPKSFAFTAQKDDEDSIDPNTKPLTTQQGIIINLLSVGMNFILSDSKLVRSEAISLIDNGIGCFKTNHESSAMCQLIHQAWPNLMITLKDSATKEINTTQSDIMVLEACSRCFQRLFEKFPLFMRDRFVKDFWRLFILKCVKFAVHKEKSMHYTLAPNHLKSLQVLFGILKAGIVFCKPSTEVCIEIVDYFQDLPLTLTPYEIFNVIGELEPDVIWYTKFIQSGNLKEIRAPNERLKSFSLK